MTDQPNIIICMGSQTDWPTMKAAKDILDQLDVACDVRIISAHRTPDRLSDFAKSAAEDGVQVIIAGAGGAAHLPGMIAAHTCVPVLGVPVESKALKGMDSLLSIVQMPGGVPVGTLAIGRLVQECRADGTQILALNDAGLRTRLQPGGLPRQKPWLTHQICPAYNS